MTTIAASPAQSYGMSLGTHGLGPAMVGRYDDDGYLLIPGFFDPGRIEAAYQESQALLGRTELIHQENLRCRWQTDVRDGSCTFECFDPVADISPACAALAIDARLLAAVGSLYGEEAHLFKDKLIFKPPGATGYGLHQDYIAWPSFPRSFLTVLIPLERADETNGCTEVFTGYHKGGTMSAEDGQYHELSPEAVDPASSVMLRLCPGDIAIFGGLTPHRSAPNLSDGYRRQLYVSYNANSDGGEQRDRHYGEFIAWLRTKYAQYGKTNVSFQ